jgi:hypothetical protein
MRESQLEECEMIRDSQLMLQQIMKRLSVKRRSARQRLSERRQSERRVSERRLGGEKRLSLEKRPSDKRLSEKRLGDHRVSVNSRHTNNETGIMDESSEANSEGDDHPSEGDDSESGLNLNLSNDFVMRNSGQIIDDLVQQRMQELRMSMPMSRDNNHVNAVRDIN